jgi:hypothetical protein
LAWRSVDRGLMGIGTRRSIRSSPVPRDTPAIPESRPNGPSSERNGCSTWNTRRFQEDDAPSGCSSSPTVPRGTPSPKRAWCSSRIGEQPATLGLMCSTWNTRPARVASSLGLCRGLYRSRRKRDASLQICVIAKGWIGKRNAPGAFHVEQTREAACEKRPLWGRKHQA